MKTFTSADNNGKNILVFGGNLMGVHGAGAALEASKHWGARRGTAEGRQGMSYAIPTKRHWRDHRGLDLDAIRDSVVRFLNYARAHPELNFLVTRIGCGYAGYQDYQISPMFEDASENCVLPDGRGVSEEKTAGDA